MLKLSTFIKGQPIIYRQALQPHVPIAATIEDVLPGDKFGIRTIDDKRYCVVKGERLSPVESLADESDFIDPPAAPDSLPLARGRAGDGVDSQPETAPSVEPITAADFHIGQIVMYDVGTYHMGSKNPPIRATVIKIAKQKTRILIDGTTEECWVFPRKLSPLPVDAPAPDSDLSPLSMSLRNGEGLGEGLDTPRPVNLTHSAITGFCTDCGCQYDKIFENDDMEDPQISPFVYWSAFTEPCPVCKILRTNHDTEELPAVPALPAEAQDEDSMFPPGEESAIEADLETPFANPIEVERAWAIEHARASDSLPLAGGRVGDEVNPDAPEIPILVELVADEIAIDPFDHPAVAARIADLNQRIDDLVTAIYHAESRAEASEAKAERFQLQVLELVSKIPAPQQAALDQADKDRLEFLCQRHLRLSLASALGMLRFEEDYAVKYPTFEAMCKSIAQRLTDRSIPVLAYNVKTEVAKNDTLYLSLSFGFASVALFNDRQTDIEHAFAHTSHHEILQVWKNTSFSYDFTPPVKIKLFRDSRGYPKLFELIETTEDES